VRVSVRQVAAAGDREAEELAEAIRRLITTGRGELPASALRRDVLARALAVLRRRYGVEPRAAAERLLSALLMRAVAVGDIAAARRLLDAGADPRAAWEGGDTPLHEACRAMDFAMARLLLERGADPAAANGEGDTPLHLIAEVLGDFPCRGECEELVSEMLRRGADPHAFNSRGETPFLLAWLSGNESLLRLLSERVDKRDAGWPYYARLRELEERGEGGGEEARRLRELLQEVFPEYLAEYERRWRAERQREGAGAAHTAPGRAT